LYTGYELWRLRLSRFAVTDWRLWRWRLCFLALMTATRLFSKLLLSGGIKEELRRRKEKTLNEGKKNSQKDVVVQNSNS